LGNTALKDTLSPQVIQ